MGLLICSVLIHCTALYGKPYITAAKDTWRLFKDRGIDALVNDSLVGMSEYCPPLPPRVLTNIPASSHLGRLRNWSALLAVLVPLPTVYVANNPVRAG